MWTAASGFVDDLLLLAASRSSMDKMLKISVNYIEIHNISFSTDSPPSKLKTRYADDL